MQLLQPGGEAVSERLKGSIQMHGLISDRFLKRFAGSLKYKRKQTTLKTEEQKSGPDLEKIGRSGCDDVEEVQGREETTENIDQTVPNNH